MLVEHQASPNPTSETQQKVASDSAPKSYSSLPQLCLEWVRGWDRWDWFSLALPLLALSPLLVVGARMLWNKQHMQFFPLAIVAVIWFIVTEGLRRRPSERRSSLARIGAWSVICLTVVASVIHSSWLAHLTSVAALFFWMVGKFGHLSLTRMLGISGLGLITLPFPFNGDQELVRTLQRISSFACSRMMDSLGILHVRMGNVLELANKQLLVEEACSGVDSQYALMAVAGILLLFGRASVWVSILTIITVPIWAILGNMLRIFSIVMGVEYLGIDLSIGWQHTLLGLIAFAMAAWAHWSSVQFLNWLEWIIAPPCQLTQSRIRNHLSGSETLQNHNSLSVTNFGISVACGLLIFVPLGWFFISGSYFSTNVPLLAERFIASLPGERSSIPRLLGSSDIAFETVRRFRGHQEGQCSRTWRVSSVGSTQMLSLDLPFRGGHPLWVCYAGTGWTLTSERTIDLFSEHLKKNWPINEIIMRGPEGQWAILHFVHAEISGNPFDNNATRFVDSVADTEHRARWLDEFSRAVRDRFIVFPSKRNALPLTVQFQLLTSGTEVPSADHIEGTRREFQACRERFLIEMQPIFEFMQSEFD